MPARRMRAVRPLHRAARVSPSMTPITVQDKSLPNSKRVVRSQSVKLTLQRRRPTSPSSLDRHGETRCLPSVGGSVWQQQRDPESIDPEPGPAFSFLLLRLGASWLFRAVVQASSPSPEELSPRLRQLRRTGLREASAGAGPFPGSSAGPVI
jgi:hypothetical protein